MRSERAGVSLSLLFCISRLFFFSLFRWIFERTKMKQRNTVWFPFLNKTKTQKMSKKKFALIEANSCVMPWPIPVMSSSNTFPPSSSFLLAAHVFPHANRIQHTGHTISSQYIYTFLIHLGRYSCNNERQNIAFPFDVSPQHAKNAPSRSLVSFCPNAIKWRNIFQNSTIQSFKKETQKER